MKIAIDFLVGIGASLAVGLAINVAAGAGIDHGVATCLVIAVIDVILLVIYKESFSIQVKTLLLSLVGIVMGGVIFIALYFIQKIQIMISAPSGFLDYAIYFINVAVLIPLFEEITVRRLMFIGSSHYIGPIFSALFVSALFAATHGSQFLFAFIFSIVMCLMAWKGISTYNRAILHGSYNGTLSMLWIIFGINVMPR
ncbi:MAG: CPBP family glutamic-type intramembrane protease [Metallibacterium sp.]